MNTTDEIYVIRDLVSLDFHHCLDIFRKSESVHRMCARASHLVPSSKEESRIQSVAPSLRFPVQVLQIKPCHGTDFTYNLAEMLESKLPCSVYLFGLYDKIQCYGTLLPFARITRVHVDTYAYSTHEMIELCQCEKEDPKGRAA